MSDDYQRIEVITGTARRRRWSAEEKLRIVEETFASGETISSVARRNGVAANLLYRWRRLMTEGATIAVRADDDVVAASEIKRLTTADTGTRTPTEPQDAGGGDPDRGFG
jgi:transposase